MEHIKILRPNLCLISGQDPQFSNMFKINKLDLLWVPNFFIAIGIYFIFGIKFSWNAGIDTCFNVECVLILTIILIFLVVTWWLLFVTWWLLDVTARYWWLLFVTARYCSFPLLVWTLSFHLKRSFGSWDIHIFVIFLLLVQRFKTYLGS